MARGIGGGCVCATGMGRVKPKACIEGRGSFSPAYLSRANKRKAVGVRRKGHDGLPRDNRAEELPMQPSEAPVRVDAKSFQDKLARLCDTMFEKVSREGVSQAGWLPYVSEVISMMLRYA